MSLIQIDKFIVLFIYYYYYSHKITEMQLFSALHLPAS